MENPYAIIDSTDFPLVTVTFTGNKPTEESFNLYTSQLEACYARGDKFTIIFDGRKAVFPSFKFQKMQAKWLKDHEKLIKSQCLGTAYIVANLGISFALRTIFMLQPQPVDYTVVSSLSEAIYWATEQMDKNKKK